MGSWGTNFSEILIKIQNFSFRKMHLIMSSAQWRPFCPGEDELSLGVVQTLTSRPGRGHGTDLPWQPASSTDEGLLSWRKLTAGRSSQHYRLFYAPTRTTSSGCLMLHRSTHRTTYQKRQFGVIQAIRSGQVTCQELGQSNPSTRWGGSPT